MAVRTSAPERSAQADERLMVEAAQQNPARFADLYELHFATVYAFAARRASSREMAEDITSDVFHKALANIKQFEWRGVPFAAWLLRIAANTFADRSRKSAKELLVDEVPESPASPSLADVDEQARLFRLVDELPSEQRQVVVMRFAEEKSIRDIALHMGRSEGAIKQLQFRGLQTLRRKLDARNPKHKSSRKSGGGNG